MKESDIRDKNIHDRLSEIIQKCNDKYVATFAKTNCFACKSRVSTLEFKKWGFECVSCDACGAWFINPRPIFDDLKKLYSDTEYVSCQNALVSSGKEARRLRVVEKAKYIRDRLEDRQVIGDIGAGQGVFLEELSKMLPSNQYIAIEPAEESVEICKNKGLEVKQSLVEDIDDMENYFDCLTTSELLEHVYDPRRFLEKIWLLLKPNGILFMTTLALGWDIQVLREHAKGISPMQHLNFFNTHSMNILLESIGFVDIEILTPGMLDCDIVENAVKDGVIDVELPWHSSEEKEKFQSLIREEKRSSHMWVLAKKRRK